MLLVLDVYYRAEGVARCGCVVARSWFDEQPVRVFTTDTPITEPYESGAFFRRELPALVAAIESVIEPVEAVVVDGYVYLDAENRAGLGRRLWDHYCGRFSVVGVAKTPFQGSVFAQHVFRGGSRRPLYVTSVGLPDTDAASLVSQMSGRHRSPRLITLADAASRSPLPLP